MSGRSQHEVPLRLCFTGTKLPSSSSACAWSARSEKVPSAIVLQARAPVLPVCDSSQASLKPNEKPLRKRRLNDVWSEWLVSQPRGSAWVIELKPRKARIWSACTAARAGRRAATASESWFARRKRRAEVDAR